MAQERTEVTVRVHNEDGCIWAEVLELPGVFATGDDLTNLHEALEEAVSLYLGHPAQLDKLGEPVDRVEDHRTLIDV